MTTETYTEPPGERMWCLTCGTVTRDQHCNCTKMDTGTANFVNYADRLFEICRQAITEAAQLRTSHDALVAALRELNYAIEELSVSANFEMRSAAWGRIEMAQRAARAALSSIGGGKP